MSETRASVEAAIALKQQLLADAELLERCDAVAECITSTLKLGNKVLFGAMAGAQRMHNTSRPNCPAAFVFDRPPLYAESLHVNTSYLTAVANDYGYDEVFARLVTGCGRPGDVLVVLTTSGTSANIVRASDVARKMGMTVVAFTGGSGGHLKGNVDFLINVPSDDTAYRSATSCWVMRSADSSRNPCSALVVERRELVLSSWRVRAIALRRAGCRQGAIGAMLGSVASPCSLATPTRTLGMLRCCAKSTSLGASPIITDCSNRSPGKRSRA